MIRGTLYFVAIVVVVGKGGVGGGGGGLNTFYICLCPRV